MLRQQIVFYIFVIYCITVCWTATNANQECGNVGSVYVLGDNEFLVDKMIKNLVAQPVADVCNNDDVTMKLYRKYIKDRDRGKALSAPLTSFLINYESLPKLSGAGSMVQCKDASNSNKPVSGHCDKKKPSCPMKNKRPEQSCEDATMDPLEHGLLMIRNIRQHASIAIKNANELEMEIMARCQADQKQCHKPMS